jgi:hypothetical protein
LASAINLGATYPGIKAAAEAVTQVECDVYEVWSLLDTYGSGRVSRSWDEVENLDNSGSPLHPTWDEIENLDPSPTQPSWNQVEDVTVVGRSGSANRSEVVVVPKKDYSKIEAEDGVEEAKRQRAEDESGLIRVLNRLKPASVLLTVDSDGIALHADATITNLTSDSNFWEITTRTAPRADLITPQGVDAYPLSLRQQITGVLYNSKRVLPKPPWTVQDAALWSYAPSVVTVKSFAFATGDDDDMTSPGDGPVTDPRSDQTVMYLDGTRETFRASRAIMDPRRALAARYASEGILVAHPYAASREAVNASG